MRVAGDAGPCPAVGVPEVALQPIRFVRVLGQDPAEKDVGMPLPGVLEQALSQVDVVPADPLGDLALLADAFQKNTPGRPGGTLRATLDSVSRMAPWIRTVGRRAGKRRSCAGSKIGASRPERPASLIAASILAGGTRFSTRDRALRLARDGRDRSRAPGRIPGP